MQKRGEVSIATTLRPDATLSDHELKAELVFQVHQFQVLDSSSEQNQANFDGVDCLKLVKH